MDEPRIAFQVGNGVMDLRYMEKIVKMTQLVKPVEGKMRVGIVHHESHCSLWQQIPPCTCNPRIQLVEPEPS